MGSRCWLWLILFALSRLEPAPAQATALRQQAREIIDYISQHTSPDFRASFLGSPAVHSLITKNGFFDEPAEIDKALQEMDSPGRVS